MRTSFLDFFIPSVRTFFLDKKSNKKIEANPIFVCHLFSLKEKVAPKVQADFDAEIVLARPSLFSKIGA